MDNYEKKYKEALEWARKVMQGKIGFVLDDVLEKFPELKESEDERIRKELICFLETEIPPCNARDKYIAWLEKQAEQKPDVSSLLSWSKADEEMFRLLEGIVKDYWAKAEQKKNKIKIREASNVSYFLKTIQKSPLCWIKCSDGLPNRDGTYLVVTDGLYNEVYDMARYDSIEGWHKASEIIYWMPIPQLNDKSIIKQNPANYAKTRKDEQKPAEWNTNDEQMLNSTIKDLIHPCYEEIPDRIEEEIKWIKSMRNRVVSQPKQEWSEEDEYCRHQLIVFCENCMQPDSGAIRCANWLKSIKDRIQPQSQSDERYRLLGKLKEWLDEYVSNLADVDTDTLICSFTNYLDGKLPKSLRPQPKQKWSEEDEQYLLVCKNALAKYQTTDKWDAHIISHWLEDKLKSLRLQKQWKPSEEQMNNK